MGMSKLQLEKKYGITIACGVYWSIFKQKLMNDYKIYSADGCPWDKGFSTLKEVEKECKTWEKQLLEIKANVERLKGGK